MPATSSMLFSNVSSPQRRVIVQQQHLMFPDIPSPHDAVWAQLDNEQRAAIVEVLARLLVQMKLPHEALKEITND
jgi:Mg-chelatase subunit ChlI